MEAFTAAERQLIIKNIFLIKAKILNFTNKK